MSDGETKQAVRAFWTAHPQVYRRGLDAPTAESLATIDRKVFEHHAPWAHVERPLLSKLVPYAELAGCRVLDLGCGTGWAMAEFARAKAQVCGLDLASTHLKWSRSRLDREALAGMAIEGDGACLPFRSHSFDYVLAWGVLMHAPDPALLAREMMRVLKPGGRFGVMLYHQNSLHWRWTIHALHGWLRLERLRASAAEVARRHTNNPELGGSPVARAYSRTAACTMFRAAGASTVEASVYDLPQAMGYFPAKRLPLLGWLPHRTKLRLAERFGFHLWVHGRA